MRTKILIVTAAALAAGFLSSNAQVFSANIVGYVNLPLHDRFNPAANPLNALPNNSATNVLPNADASKDGWAIYTWSGSLYTPHLADSSVSSGWTDAGGNPETPPTLNPGSGFLIFPLPGVTNVTFVGEVVGVSNSIHTVQVMSVPAKPLLNLVSSIAPLGGGVSSVLQLSNVAGARDGDVIQKLNTSDGIPPHLPLGSLIANTVILIDSGNLGTGFTDLFGVEVPEPTFNVAIPFFYNGHGVGPGSPTPSPDWHQDLP